MAKILVLTDDSAIGVGVVHVLTMDGGYEAEAINCWTDFAAAVHRFNPDAILMDAAFDWSILLPTLKKYYEHLPLVLFSQLLGAEEVASRSVKVGTSFWSASEDFPRSLLSEVQRALKK